MIRMIAAALAALALTSFGVLADDAPKADAPAAEKKMDKPKKAHKKGKKAKKAADTKPADAPAK
jgi:Spy/CpxP family protein refolding chaperone